MGFIDKEVFITIGLLMTLAAILATNIKHKKFIKASDLFSEKGPDLIVILHIKALKRVEELLELQRRGIEVYSAEEKKKFKKVLSMANIETVSKEMNKKDDVFIEFLKSNITDDFFEFIEADEELIKEARRVIGPYVDACKSLYNMHELNKIIMTIQVGLIVGTILL